MNRLARLEDMPVIAEDGTRLGRVVEIRSPGQADVEPTYAHRPVESLLCGRPGLFERLGWTPHEPQIVPWRDVLAVHARRIVVRGSAADYATHGAS